MGDPRLLLVPGAMLISLASCKFPEDPGHADRIPLRWQLVERRYSDLADAGVSGDGRVDPDAFVLALEPVYPEELSDTSGSARLSVEILELFPEREAGVGQPISAIVRVANSAPDARYRLRVEALDPRV